MNQNRTVSAGPTEDLSQWVGWSLIWSRALDSDIVTESQSIENIS
eukprot:SAG25_NODE_212_length_11793_cov_15.035146_11_plen_45_part_00